ncbi:MAG: GWxTD domain-containing protein [Flavobacteriales bacterium]|nr:GWxTD domain-containing protein [Flavobacteriales bacterium]
MTRKQMSGLWLTLVLLVSALGWVGCGSYSGITSNYRFLYDYESTALHPSYTLYHHSNDSSTLLLKLSTAELLFVRTDANSPFFCAAQVRWTLFRDEGSALAEADSGSFVMSDSGMQPHERLLLSEHHIPMSASPGLTLRIDIRDLNRPVEFTGSISVEKENIYSPQHFLLRDSVSGAPLFGYYTDSTRTIRIEHQRAPDQLVKAWVNRNEVKLPPPPFSSSQPTPPLMEDFIPEKVTRQPGYTYIRITPGMHFISTDPSRETGISLFCVHRFFPEIKDVGQLIAPLRYITSKTEYGELEKSEYAKKMVDNFWMDCGGSKEKARDLIRIYYGRVQEANRYFSTYTEGWRTDRGMIHLVFGNPNKVYRRSNSETWVYGDEGTASSLQFQFVKQNLPFSDNVYVLQRDPLHKPYWERAVTAWRSGRVYGD